MSQKEENPKQRSLGKVAVRSAIWMLSAAWMMSVLQLVVLFSLSRLLEPSDFGLMAAALVVLGFGDIFADLGVGAALIQKDDISKAEVAAAFWASLGFGLGVSGLVFASSGVLASAFGMKSLMPILEVASMSYVLKGMAVVPLSVLQRDLRFRETALIEVVAYAFGYALVAFGLAWLGYGAAALVAGVLVQSVIRLVLLWVRSDASFFVRFERANLKEILLFGGGITLSAIFNYAARNADNAVIGRLLGEAALGFYGRSYRLMTTSVTLVAKVIDKVLFSALSREKDLERSARTYRNALGLIASSLLPFSALTGIFAPEIVRLALGPGWDASILPFQVLCVGMIFRTSYKISGALARAQGAVYQIAWRNGVYAICVVTGAILGSMTGRLEMVAVGVLGALFLFFMLMTDLCIRLLPLTWWNVAADHFRAVVFSVVVAGALLATRFFCDAFALPDLASLGLGAVVFGVVSLLLIVVAPHAALGKDGCELLVRSVGYVLKNRGGIQKRLSRVLRVEI